MRKKLLTLSMAGVMAGGISGLALGMGKTPETTLVDCPMRDEPYSVDGPLMDILLNPRAKAIANQHMHGVLDKLPRQYASPEPPSFSAIINLNSVASLARLPKESLIPLDKELRQLSLTDEDKALRCQRYDTEPPVLDIPAGNPSVLVFNKINGFKDVPSFNAALDTLRSLAKERGWALVETENGAVMNEAQLKQFDVVVWNNISGDVLTLTQREAFKRYINSGGGYVGIHGSGGDYSYHWQWYVDELIGAQFIGHPSDPQLQKTTVQIEDSPTGIGGGLAKQWVMTDEWYSFAPNPRENGAMVVASIDESQYSPTGRPGQKLRMGEHPIAWARCVGEGKAFYSAIGHAPEVYDDENHKMLLVQGIEWAAGITRARGCNSR